MKIKAYLVEDSLSIRDNLIATLEELTSVTIIGTAESETESVVWLNDRSHTWDLAIVDLYLKQGTGLGVISACKKRSKNQKVIVLSNYATPDVRKQCAALGADAVFDKSTEIEQLLDYCKHLSLVA